MLELDHLCFSYGKGRTRKPVLEDLCYRADPGRLIAVLGANGAGKSTLFRCILGFQKPESGTIRVGGSDIRSLSRRELAKLTAYIPQTESPIYNYTVLDTVLMGTTGTLSPLQSPGAAQQAQAEQALQTLGITALQHRGIQELSGGERQLVLLARAIAQNAQLLIMDEPTANLDYGNQQLVLRHVRSMADRGYTILLSTHNPEHALQYATDTLALKDRRILASGSTESVLTEQLIETIYGMQVRIVTTEIDGKAYRSCIPATGSSSDTLLNQACRIRKEQRKPCPTISR